MVAWNLALREKRYKKVRVTCAWCGAGLMVPVYRLQNVSATGEFKFYHPGECVRSARQMASGLPVGTTCLVVVPAACKRTRWKRGLCRTHSRAFERGELSVSRIRKYSPRALRAKWKRLASYEVVGKRRLNVARRCKKESA